MSFYSGGARVTAGLVIAGLGVCLVIPLIALIGYRMLRMDRKNPLLALIQLVAGAAPRCCCCFPCCS